MSGKNIRTRDRSRYNNYDNATSGFKKRCFLTKQPPFVIATLSFVIVAFPSSPPGDKFPPAFPEAARALH